MIKYILAGAIGAGIGAFGMYVYFKKNVPNCAECPEIDKISEFYKRKVDSGIHDVVEDISEEQTDTISEDSIKPKRYKGNAKPPTDYTKYRPASVEEEYPTEEEVICSEFGEIEIISEQDYDALESYDSVSLIYYADGYLINDFDEAVYEEGETIGEGTLSLLENSEDGVLYARNHLSKIDYEICKSLQTYDEAKAFDR